MSSSVAYAYERDSDLSVWWGTRVELASMLGRRERGRDLTPGELERAQIRLDDLAGQWTEIQPTESIRRAAIRLLRVHPLRAGDALQLAAAITASEGDPNSLAIVSLDAQLNDAARKEGFRIVPA